ncbi:hypothetical protein [Scrofimicrobium canadense]|uniref:hypothetical protein n=1 Tax=Scrofimicrobium canadense TaxID=2652290 RepID=UPI0012B2AC81|nr:hypothetical protein [Scrofimicrobium canadense]
MAHKRREVFDCLRRVLVIQAVQLACFSVIRLAEVEGHPMPDPPAFFYQKVVNFPLVREPAVPFLRFKVALHVTIEFIMEVIAAHSKSTVIDFSPSWLSCTKKSKCC